MVFELVHPDGKIPIVKTMYSAGLDFYSREQVEIEPGKTVIVGVTADGTERSVVPTASKAI